MALWKKALIKLLRGLLAQLEASPGVPTSSKAPPHEASNEALPLRPASVIVEVPEKSQKSHVEAKAVLGNPRPLYGREKFREQLHLAHCCKVHGCCYNSKECPVVFYGEEAYLKECC